MYINILISPTAEDEDHSMNTSVPLIFTPGSVDGAEMCIPLTAVADLLVENEEEFTVKLNLVTTGPSLNLGNRVSPVTIIDGEGIHEPFMTI